MFSGHFLSVIYETACKILLKKPCQILESVLSLCL
nr:MAG TPA: hypothetical protein [Caudoviricetes sp.]